MQLYKINEQIVDVFKKIENEEIDIENGAELLEQLSIQKDEKIENIALFYKNVSSEIDALKAEKLMFEKRIKQKENLKERLKETLKFNLLQDNKNKFETSKVNINFRKSTTLSIEDVDALIVELQDKNLENLYKVEQKTEKTVDKTKLKMLINNDLKQEKQQYNFKNAYVIEKQNIQIK